MWDQWPTWALVYHRKHWISVCHMVSKKVTPKQMSHAWQRCPTTFGLNWDSEYLFQLVTHMLNSDQIIVIFYVHSKNTVNLCCYSVLNVHITHTCMKILKSQRKYRLLLQAMQILVAFPEIRVKTEFQCFCRGKI